MKALRMKMAEEKRFGSEEKKWLSLWQITIIREILRENIFYAFTSIALENGPGIRP